MAIHHIDDKSDAIRIILEEWDQQKQELETLRKFMPEKVAEREATPSNLTTAVKPSPLSPQPQKDIYCILDGYWLPKKITMAKCEKCKLENFQTWAECQRKQSLK